MRTTLRFFDDYWLELRRNTRRRWYTPTLIGTLGKVGIYPSAAWCPEAGVYRLWYEVLPDFAQDGKRYLALAESDDCKAWRDVPVPAGRFAPEVESLGSVVLAGLGERIHGTGVYRDPFEKDPMRLYKACTLGEREAGPPHARQRGVVLCCSPDGVHWDFGARRPVYPRASDTYNCILYNPVSSAYQVLLRASHVDRRIAMIQSPDLEHWSPPVVVIHPDAGYADDGEMVQLYAMWAGWFDGMFLGHLWRFHTDPADEGSPKMVGYMDTELVYSYNGANWMHTTRRPLIPRPEPPAYGASQLCLSGMFETRERDGWILVACASRAVHSTSRENKRLQSLLEGGIVDVCFYRIRKDGLCGLECFGRKGTVATKPFELLEADLTVNTNAALGTVRFAVTDAEARPLEGFSFEDCRPYTGDGTEVRPSWSAHALEELKGRRVRIWAEMDTAVLYSVSATMRPYIRDRQVSVCDPTPVEDAMA